MENGLTTTLRELRKQRNEITRQRAKTIYAICRSVTPQFYTKQTPDEMDTMLNTIQLVIQNIREDILTVMCNLAVAAYPNDKAKKPNTFFDINYILGFYKQAWDEAKPKDYINMCFCGKHEGKFKVGYCKDEDFDFEKWQAKPNADIWWDER